MNANHTAITVMKQAAGAPDKGDLSEREGGKGWQVAAWPLLAMVLCLSPYRKPHRTKVVFSTH